MFKKKVKYAFYTLGHPSDGFYEIRHRGRGSVGLSILFVFLFAVCGLCGQQCKSDGDQQSRGDLCGISSVLSVLCRKLVDHLPDGR